MMLHLHDCSMCVFFVTLAHVQSTVKPKNNQTREKGHIERRTEQIDRRRQTTQDVMAYYYNIFL